jgi:hypothetical protein
MFTYVVLAAGYGTIALTAIHALAGNWSGMASLGNAGSLLIGVPYLSWRAWQLRGLRSAPWPARTFWLLCLGFPVIFLMFWLVASVMVGAKHEF